MNFRQLLPVKKPVIGMIHVQALPGTPLYLGDFRKVVQAALKDARAYIQGGVDAIMLENMHDLPYLKGQVGHEISTAMAVIGYQVAQLSAVPVGMQILAGANEAAIAAAKSAGLSFVRAEGFVFGHVADEGWIDASAGPLLRYRKQIGAEDVLVLTDIKKKHSAHALTADVDLRETAKAAEFFHSDGLIVTGAATGAGADPDELDGLNGATQLPVLVGSGITIANVRDYFPRCEGFIVGSHFKEKGDWKRPVELTRVRDFMSQITTLRNTIG